MKHHLLNIFDEEIKPELFDELKRESPTIDQVIYQHLTIIHASILGGLIEKSKKPNGAKAIKNLVEKGNHDGSIFDRIPQIFTIEQQLSDIKKLGNSLLAFVFDDGTERAFEKIQHFLSEKYLTKEEDLIEVNRMIAPFSMGLIGRIIHDEAMTDEDIHQMLKQNEPLISMRFPGLAKVLGLKATIPDTISPSKPETPDISTSVKKHKQLGKNQKSIQDSVPGGKIELDDDRRLFLQSLWPWVLLLVVSGLSLFLLKKFQSEPTDLVEAKQDNPFNFIQSDSLVTTNNNAFTLPGNVQLKVDKNSMIDSLLRELKDKDGQIDTLRFLSSKITFQDSTSILTSAANKELSDLLTILQSYPDILMDINLNYNNEYQDLEPSLAEKQIKSLRDYFTVFGLDQSRLKITRNTVLQEYPNQDTPLFDTLSKSPNEVIQKKPGKNKNVELLFYLSRPNSVDSLNIQ